MLTESTRNIDHEAVGKTLERVGYRHVLKKRFRRIFYSSDSDDGSNTYEPIKFLGDLFVLQEGTVPRRIIKVLQDSGIPIESNQVAELHVRGSNFLTKTKLTDSINRLTSYTSATSERNTNRPGLEWIYGITWIPADRWGFTKIKIPQDLPVVREVKHNLKLELLEMQEQRLKWLAFKKYPAKLRRKITTLKKAIKTGEVHLYVASATDFSQLTPSMRSKA